MPLEKTIGSRQNIWYGATTTSMTATVVVVLAAAAAAAAAAKWPKMQALIGHIQSSGLCRSSIEHNLYK